MLPSQPIHSTDNLSSTFPTVYKTRGNFHDVANHAVKIKYPSSLVSNGPKTQSSLPLMKTTIVAQMPSSPGIPNTCSTMAAGYYCNTQNTSPTSTHLRPQTSMKKESVSFPNPLWNHQYTSPQNQTTDRPMTTTLPAPSTSHYQTTVSNTPKHSKTSGRSGTRTDPESSPPPCDAASMSSQDTDNSSQTPPLSESSALKSSASPMSPTHLYLKTLSLRPQSAA
mmetsp:Transcript_10943/g.21828  ORF Transcript_10943/g.21828 Transcript_10943/m.21828 type:complete len:223 (+) Transcript_10943:2267-2935(+)